MLSKEFLKNNDMQELEMLQKISQKARICNTTQGDILKMSATLVANMEVREFQLLQELIKQDRKVRLRFRGTN